MSSSTQQKTAIVFGASGISGWRLCQELLEYPTKTTFSRVIALSNRPQCRRCALLPEDRRLELYSGVDLTQSPEKVTEALKEKIPRIEDVTQAYFFAYVHGPGDGSVVAVNSALLENSIIALEKLSPKLEHFVLQTGCKTYGVEYAPALKPPPNPWKEDQTIPEPYRSRMFYYKQVEILSEHGKNASWKWTEVRPNGLVGFCPVPNGMNLALAFGVYFSLWRKVYGKGSSIPYPGGLEAYGCLNTDSLMGPTARFEIYCSLNGEKTHAQAIHVGTRAGSYAEKWPMLAACFGLVGVLRVDEEVQDAVEWAEQHRDKWAELEAEFGLREGALESSCLPMIGYLGLPFRRDTDVSKSFEVGFDEKQDLIEGYLEAWGTMAKAKMIPPV